MTGSEPTLREALAMALMANGIAVENVASMGNAEQWLPDYELTDKLLAALPPAAPDAEHEALRDRVFAWAHLEKEARKSDYPEEYRQRMRDNADEALNDLDAYLDDHPDLLAKYEALWGAIEEKG